MKTFLALVGSLLFAVVGASPSVAAEDDVPPGTQHGAAVAYRELGCKYGGAFGPTEQDSPGRPYRGVTCYTKFGGFSILHYESVRGARAYWRHHLAKGEYLVHRGNLIVVFSELEATAMPTYSRKPTRWAARKLDGHLLQGVAS